jgi:ubiquinone/menaquinone biosynthesis C-methylase UbiE
MTSAYAETANETARAFDSLATEYDEVFTRSTIGRAQRNVVWKRAADLFQAGKQVLELNCGTGEDALFLSRLGISVVACDASSQMIDQAKQRREQEEPQANIRFEVLQIERLADLQNPTCFDGVFSNFSGLNCVPDLAAVAKQLSMCVNDGAPLLLCLSTRVCLWEILHFLFQGNFHKAFRRCRGQTIVRLGDVSFPVHYPTIRELRAFFSPSFALRSYSGVGIAVPPSYMESWARKHPKILRALQQIDALISDWPIFRVVGDHVLLRFEKVRP